MTAQAHRPPEADRLYSGDTFSITIGGVSFLPIMSWEDMCSILIGSADREAWQNFSGQFPWNQDRNVLRTIACMLAPCEPAEDVLCKFIRLRVLHLEDYETLRIVGKRARWEAAFAIVEAANAFGRNDYGHKLAYAYFISSRDMSSTAPSKAQKTTQRTSCGCSLCAHNTRRQ
jgi:hypothetical protein